jgi:hypothetical protein
VPKLRTVRLAESWVPDPTDPYGKDKQRLVRFLLENRIGSENPITLKAILKTIRFEQGYSREGLQHKLLGPLRRDNKVFVGTSSKGIFLVTTPQDVDTTLGFYTWRVRAELRHARNLRTLAKRTKILEGYESKIPENKERAVIFLDESGNPDINDLHPRVFVIAAVVIGSRQDISGLDQRFKNAFATIKRSEDHEFRTAGLSVAKHARVLRELSLLEYQWAAACFDKQKLLSEGFADPRTFYRYAFQFLVGDLLTIAWQADLVIDENSTPDFQVALEQYLRRQNSGLPINKLGSIKFTASSKERLIQLADLVAGAVRRSVNGDRVPLREIEHQMINLQFWPPR